MRAAVEPRSKREPATVAELLDQEEAHAIEQIVGAVQRMADEAVLATDLRERIRRHPSIALSLAAFFGFAAAPLFGRAARRALAATVKSRNSTPLHSRSLQELALASLRAFGAVR